MQLITLCFGLIVISVAIAPAASTSTSTYSSILTAAVATSSIAVTNASQGFCAGGRTYCGMFSGSDTNPCPSPYCQLEGNSCDPAEIYAGNGGGPVVPCSVLTEDECNAAGTEYPFDCKYVNQGKTDSVLIAFTTISLFWLLVITIVVCRRLPLPKKETVMTQPLLDEENS